MNDFRPTSAWHHSTIAWPRPLLESLGDYRKAATEYISSGYEELDKLLPHGGFRRGSLVEWFPGEPHTDALGTGAATLSLCIAIKACQPDGALVVVEQASDRQTGLTFYPPAAFAWGITEEQLVIVHPETTHEAIWSIDQALRHPAVSAVWAPFAQLDPRSFRRLQLSAESGTSLGCLLRPHRARKDPSWSDLQLSVQPTPSTPTWTLQLRCLRSRGFIEHAPITIDLCGALSYGH